MLKYQQILLQQNDVSGLFCHVNSGVNGDSYVGGTHCSSVVDTVAHEADHVVVGPECRDNTSLLHRGKLCKELGLLDTLFELLIIKVLYVATKQKLVNVDAHLLADGSGNAFVIAGKYLDLHASLVELGNCLASALFWRIQEGQVANEHHVALIVYAKLADATRVTLLSNANHAHAFLIELVDAVHNVLALSRSQRFDFRVQVNKGACVEDFFNGALGDHMRFVSFCISHYNAHAATLKVKWDLVDFFVLNAQQVSGQLIV